MTRVGSQRHSKKLLLLLLLLLLIQGYVNILFGWMDGWIDGQKDRQTYTIAVCTVKTPDDGQRNSPKHVDYFI
jgi:hypothetical protein